MARMLDPDEPPPFEVVNPDGRGSAFLICDHASHRLPRALGTLGLSEAQRREHIGWDIGAAVAARRLAERLDAPLVLSGYSRLAIDCNRPPGVPSSIPALTCGVAVPGNEGLSDEQVRLRQHEIFWPYHRAIEALLAGRPRPRALLSIHSFTHDYPGQLRPWPISMVYGQDRRLAALMLDELRSTHGLLVGDNEPYRVTGQGDYGIPTYGEQRGIPAVLVELRQDGVTDDAQARAWGDRLADVYLAIEPRLPPG